MKRNKIDLNKLVRSAGFAGHPEFPKVIQDAIAMYERGDDPTTIITLLKMRYPVNKFQMRQNRVETNFFGSLGVDFGYDVENQISEAAKLPVAVKAAVMPDAHLGYALPIGGVVALENAISPHFVGFDIACRMSCSVLAISPDEFMKHRSQLFNDLKSVTSFGVGADFATPNEHDVMYYPLWNEIPILKQHKDLAWKQLGSSGGGNHFADFMIGVVAKTTPQLPLPVGTEFVALVTHSGSRGPGHRLATHYSRLAETWAKHNAMGIPKGYEWLPMDSPEGLEYWEVMQLMGVYAQANHHTIHKRFSELSGIHQQFFYENHHNFAWYEDGYYVHRKGATPAHKGEFGIIPGSMGTHSYLVVGLGNEASINSSSHGAGRLNSRKVAKEKFQSYYHNWHILQNDILVQGVEPDESFQAYKDIDHVIDVQTKAGLIEVVATMMPKAVIMGGKSDDGD